MIFNNQLITTNLLGTCYVSGNIIFNQNLLYTPVFNYVKQIDLANNHT